MTALSQSSLNAALIEWAMFFRQKKYYSVIVQNPLKLFGLSFFSIGKLFKLMTLILSVLSNTPRGMSYRIGNRILAIEAWDLLTASL